MTQQRKKGAIGIEFVIATALFLAAFWFIYFQSALMLTPQLQRGDIRELAVEFYSGQLITDPGSPNNWVASPTRLGFAEYTGGAATPGVLDRSKLNWANGRNCSSFSTTMAGMEFAWKVTTSAGTWECSTGIPKQGVVRRPVFVHFAAMAYRPGTLEVWAA